MAIVKGPLFSLSATGKLADALVYMTWKGINDVRKYVIPSNPKSTLQTTQRDYLKDAVTRWHVTDWYAADLTAFNNWAAIASSAMSGFNRWIKGALDYQRDGYTMEQINKAVISAVVTTGFLITLEGHADWTYTCKYGTSPTAMVETNVVTNTAGVLTSTLTGLTADTVYYVQIYCTQALKWATTGIFKQRTAAA